MATINVAGQSTHHAMVYLASLEPTTSLVIQQITMVASAICAVHNISLTFAETTGFNQNSANAGGNAIYAEMDSSLPFIGTSTFSKNTAKLDGGASLQTSTGH